MPLRARLLAAPAAARHAAVLLVALAALAASGAGPALAAPGDPLAPSGPDDGARLTAGADPGLQARGVAGDAGLELRVSRSAQPVDACLRIGAEVAQAPGRVSAADPALFSFATAAWYATPGTYYWQVVRTGSDGSCAATEARQLVLASGVPSPPDLAGLSSERIPGRIGSSNGASFVIRSGGIPAGVDRARYLALVRNAGRRWRLHSLGTVPGRPVFGNGRSEVGFSTAQVPRQALAVTVFGRPERRDARARPDPARGPPVGAGAGPPDPGPDRPPDRPPARVRPCGGQPLPRAAGLPRHPDGRRPRHRRVVAVHD